METLKQLDENIFLYLNNLGNEKWDSLWLILTDSLLALPLYLLLTILLLKRTGFKSTLISIGLVLIMIGVTYVISNLVKYGIARPRPCNEGFDMRFPLGATGKECGDYGFFSTHASSAMALIIFMGLILKRYYKRILYPLILWVLLISYSRIYVGKHYLGDVIVGLIVGYLIGFSFFKLRAYIRIRYRI